MSDGLELAPVTLRAAIRFCREVHRRRPAVQGALWAVSATRGGQIVGVAIVGRPCRLLDRQGVLVVSRVAVAEGDKSASGHKGACSMLYASVSRAARAMGATALFTYTDADEPGTSLKAAGWVMDGETAGGEWSRPSRQRSLAICSGEKHRWRSGWSIPMAEVNRD
jgi:hypothetical protein